MTKPQSRAGSLRDAARLVGAALLIVVMATACGAPATPPAPTTAPAPGGQATSPVATQPAPSSGTSTPFSTVEPGSQEPGPSAGLNPAAKFTTHYKGDPNAPVVIIEVSDFQ